MTMVTVYPNGEHIKVAKGGGGSRPGIRAECCGFTAGSRRRLIVRLMSLDFEAVPTWLLVTLTYHYGAGEDFAVWKAHLSRWVQEFGRKWPWYKGLLWRLEFQRRGVPHFHLLVACDVDMTGGLVRALRGWVSEEWNHIAEPGDVEHLRAGTRVDVVHWNAGVGALLRYLSKYLAKTDSDKYVNQETGEILRTGRLWGVRGDLPTRVVAEGECDSEQMGYLIELIKLRFPESPYLSSLDDGILGLRLFCDPREFVNILGKNVVTWSSVDMDYINHPRGDTGGLDERVD